MCTEVWTANVDLIDTGKAYTKGQPPGGWHVTPIHASLLKIGKVLLPDGTVLLISGSDRTDVSVVPPPQIIDPFTGALTTLPQWADDANHRAYHAMALLLQDGRVLVGGGRRWHGSRGQVRAHGHPRVHAALPAEGPARMYRQAGGPASFGGRSQGTSLA
jgi:hypothetical protein